MVYKTEEPNFSNNEELQNFNIDKFIVDVLQALKSGSPVNIPQETTQESGSPVVNGPKVMSSDSANSSEETAEGSSSYETTTEASVRKVSSKPSERKQSRNSAKVSITKPSPRTDNQKTLSSKKKSVSIERKVKTPTQKEVSKEVIKPDRIYILSNFLTEVALVLPKPRIGKKAIEEKLLVIMQSLNVILKFPEKRFFSDGKKTSYIFKYPFSERGKLTYIFLLYLYFKYKNDNNNNRAGKRKTIVFEYLELYEKDRFWLNYEKSIESVFPTQGQQEPFGSHIHFLVGRGEDYSIENIFVGSESAYIGFYLRYLKSKFYVSGSTDYFTRGTIVIPNTIIMIKKVSFLTTMLEYPYEFPIQLFCNLYTGEYVVLDGIYYPNKGFFVSELGANLVLSNGQFKESNGKYFDVEMESNLNYIYDIEFLKKIYMPSKGITFISETSERNGVTFDVRDKGIVVDNETLAARSNKDYSYIGLLNEFRDVVKDLDTKTTNLENYKFLKKYLFLFKDIFSSGYGNNFNEKILAYQVFFHDKTPNLFFKQGGELKIKQTENNFSHRAVYNNIHNRSFQIEYIMYIAAKKIKIDLIEEDRLIDFDLYKPLSSNANFTTMGEEKYFFLLPGKNKPESSYETFEHENEFYYYFKKSNVKNNIINEVFIEDGNFLNTLLSIQKVEYQALSVTSGKLETIEKFFLSFEKDGVGYVLKLNTLASPETPGADNLFEATVLRAEHLIKYSFTDNTFYIDNSNKIDFNFKENLNNDTFFKADSNSIMALNKAAGLNLNLLEDKYYKIPYDLKIEYTPERRSPKTSGRNITYKVKEVE
jgi:hypothetical protein